MGILSTMSDFERNLTRERQMEGIRIRKERGLYGGGKIGSKMDTNQFLQKEKSQKIIEYLKKGYTLRSNTIPIYNVITWLVLSGFLYYIRVQTRPPLNCSKNEGILFTSFHL